jgi:hypothetical protein
MFAKTCCNLSKKHILAKFYGENIFKIITSVPEKVRKNLKVFFRLTYRVPRRDVVFGQQTSGDGADEGQEDPGRGRFPIEGHFFRLLKPGVNVIILKIFSPKK